MGIGGNFWDLLKPYARNEGFDFLRNKRVAVDLSFWIVQHTNAIKTHVRKPHLRLTFFRTINLFSKFGAFPVFVVDGTPSPLKSQARIARFFRSSGIELNSLPVPEQGVSAERNRSFSSCVKECVELVELLGMPVLKAKGEAEALCAQLNSEGHVDACITADSDAFLFGAKCIIKSFRPNSKEPFECYNISDIEAGLGLKRKQLIAISLLVGNDHDMNGVRGVGLETALHFYRKHKEQKRLENWHTKVCHKIAEEPNFPNDEIIDMYLCSDNGHFSANDGPHITWERPNIGMLIDFLNFHQRWEPSYIQRLMFPMMSTMFLRDKASTTVESLFFGQYEFDSLHRVKSIYGFQLYVVKWKRAAGNFTYAIRSNESGTQQDVVEHDKLVDLLDDCDVPMIHVDDGCSFLLTDENMDLVGAAFPEEVKRFRQEQEQKDLKRKRNSTSRSQEYENENSASPNSKSIQLNITKFYPSTKIKHESKQEESSKKPDTEEGEASANKRNVSSSNLPKSVRRRLLFD
ncbi:hypothetical protein TanjilG_24921 [Lupinus angustifolius]|uniref:Flap endonuclease GEN-like 1 n=1 Tax=Lupinus angustifolius TaxID=3871 RepID=A0A4P1QZZ3_LUPAN|nr:hypothetical protein TanjilG_24921 [Lupinus angustifolius]